MRLREAWDLLGFALLVVGNDNDARLVTLVLPGTVLLDENLKEVNLSSPTVVGPAAFSRLQKAVWSDTGTPHAM